MVTSRNANALVWDFDGTIGDTFERNLRITRQIIGRVTGASADRFPALRTVQSYGAAHKKRFNWREFYISDLGLTEEQTDQAGKLWTEYQLKDGEPTPVYQGVEQVLAALGEFPHGIVSQNSKSNIDNTLQAADLSKHFTCVIGYEEVGLRKQKPEPDGLLLCIEELTAFEPGSVFFIGDHEVDATTVLNANQALARRGLDICVVSIAAAYGSHVDVQEWQVKSDYTVEDPVEIIGIVQSFNSS